MLLNENGLTVQQLKAFMASVPDQNLNGEPNTVWLESGYQLSSPAKRIVALNYRPDLQQFNILFEK